MNERFLLDFYNWSNVTRVGESQNLPNNHKKNKSIGAKKKWFNCIRIVHMKGRQYEKKRETNGKRQDHQPSLIIGCFTLKWSDCGHGFCFTIIKLQIERFAWQITIHDEQHHCRKKTIAKFTHSFKCRQSASGKKEAHTHIYTWATSWKMLLCVSLTSQPKRCTYRKRRKKTFRNPLTSSTLNCPKTNSYVKLIYLNSTFEKARHQNFYYRIWENALQPEKKKKTTHGEV